MNILHTVEFYYPSQGGAQEVIRQVSEQLVQRGHSVTVVTSKLPERASLQHHGVNIVQFDIRGNAVRGFQGETSNYQQFLLDSNFDLMMNYAAQQWATDLVFPLLGRLPYPAIMTPCGFSGLFYANYQTYFQEMPAVMQSYDHLIFHASRYRDIDFTRQHGIQHYTVIPNGASEAEFSQTTPSFRQRYDIPENIPVLLTVGNHTGLKGHRTTLEAFYKAQLGQAILVIIGNKIGKNSCLSECRRRATWINLSTFGKKKVLLINPLRSGVVSAYQAADLFIFSSNVEYSPLVLFEAMASKTPYLTTACGNAEEILEWSHGGQLVPTLQANAGMVTVNPSVYAHFIEEMMAQPEMRARMGLSGYQSWKNRFTWEKIAGDYEALYQAVIEKHMTRQTL
jgi:glycosyltransferase involved in cell wall biosynthesis